MDDVDDRPLRLEQCFGSAEDARGMFFVLAYLQRNQPRRPALPPLRRASCPACGSRSRTTNGASSTVAIYVHSLATDSHEPIDARAPSPSQFGAIRLLCACWHLTSIGCIFRFSR
jgi:hypothetical protein